MKTTATFLFLFLFFALQHSFAQTTEQKATEKIAFNKEYQRPKYEGLKVQYTFKINHTNASSDALKDLGQRAFLNVVDVNVNIRNGNTYWSILTKGDEDNDRRYQKLLDGKFMEFIEQPKQYLLL